MSFSHQKKRYNVNGILLLDKPKGLSSNDALQKIKRLYNANHAGHTGTLDPLATGMLPICFGEATKFAKFLLNSNKRYRVIANLGNRTDTSDSYGKILQNRPVCITLTKLLSVLNNFRGDIQQIPSMYSALKYKGKKLYEYARKGIEIPRKVRTITIYQLKVIHWNKNKLELEIYCSKGTYIRTLIEDIGEILGCGAHVIYLRRLEVANYSVHNMITFEYLNLLIKNNEIITLNKILHSLLLPIDSLVYHYPEVNILPIEANCIKQGQSVWIMNSFNSSIVRITEGKNHKFIGIGTIMKNGKLIPTRLLV
ncbi:tRNA pseudouridine synthase B [Serratia symbiotica]|nr:tRNA pseudouridine synthase B [Serratia symbiotica]